MNVNGLPPGLQGWVLADVMRQQQQEQAMQQQQMQFRMQQAQQAQQIAQSEEARRAQLHPLQMQNLQAQMRDLAAQRQAATEKTTQEVADKKRREALLAQVAAQLARPDEATALEAVRQAEARGEPANITARNPNMVNSLLAQLAPQQFVTQSMRPPPRERQVIPVTGGYLEQQPDGTRTFVRTQQDRPEPAPRRPQFHNTAEGIMRVDDDGNLVPVRRGGQNPDMGPPDTRPLMPPSLTSSGNQNAMRLRSEYNSDPNVKQFVTYGPAIAQTAQYVIAANKGGQVSGADDIALTKLYLSLTHPKGDQISNMDLKQLSQLGSLDDRVSRAITGFIAGRQLDKDTRNELWRTIGNRALELEKAAKARRADIESRARSMPGVDINAVFGQ